MGKLFRSSALFRGLGGLLTMGLRDRPQRNYRQVRSLAYRPGRVENHFTPPPPKPTKAIPSLDTPEVLLANEAACRYLTSKQLGFSKIEARAIVQIVRRTNPGLTDVQQLVTLCLRTHGQRT